MDELVINDVIRIPAAELSESFARSGGPGGQHVNKTETKVELRWSIAQTTALSEVDRAWLLERLADRLTAEGELVVVAGDERSQSRNRAEARRKLAALVREALRRPRRRRATRPTRSSIERRISDKKHRGGVKDGRRWTDDD